MRTALLLSITAVLSLSACSGEPGDPSGTGASNAASSSSGGNQGGGGHGGGGMIPPGAENIVFNEINAVTADWIELVNKGQADFDLSGLGVADSLNMSKEPKLDKAMRFPAGAKITAGGYVLVVLEKPGLTPGPHTDCVFGVPAGTECYYAGWGISGADGEFVHLVSADNTVITSSEYPANAVLNDRTWCRLPDKSETFAACAPTPAAENKAPPP